MPNKIARHLDLFSGIGGFALAAGRVWPGIEHTFCEIDPFCQAVLRKHWPTSKIYDDIKQLSANTRGQEQRGPPDSPRQAVPTPGRGHFDILTGGFPCQPFSHAGKRKGTDDSRHLWPQMCRVIREFSPSWVVGENVRGLLTIGGGLVFEQVCTDLEALGYEVQPFVIPACALNAPHRRDRVWIVARNTEHDGRHGTEDGEGRGARGDRDQKGPREVRQPAGSALSRGDAPDPSRGGAWQREPAGGRARQPEASAGDIGGWDEDWPQAATRLCSVDDGLSDGLVRSPTWRNAALKAAGNAIVPQVAEQIFRAIDSTL